MDKKIFYYIIPLFLIIISGSGVNHSMSKEVVNSFPEEIYQGIDKIEFTDKEHDTRGGIYRFWYWTKYNKRVGYDSTITIYNSDKLSYWSLFDILQHELGHHDYFYWKGNNEDKTKQEMEDYAIDFREYEWEAPPK